MPALDPIRRAHGQVLTTNSLVNWYSVLHGTNCYGRVASQFWQNDLPTNHVAVWGSIPQRISEQAVNWAWHNASWQSRCPALTNKLCNTPASDLVCPTVVPLSKLSHAGEAGTPNGFNYLGNLPAEQRGAFQQISACSVGTPTDRFSWISMFGLREELLLDLWRFDHKDVMGLTFDTCEKKVVWSSTAKLPANLIGGVMDVNKFGGASSGYYVDTSDEADATWKLTGYSLDGVPVTPQSFAALTSKVLADQGKQAALAAKQAAQDALISKAWADLPTGPPPNWDDLGGSSTTANLTDKELQLLDTLATEAKFDPADLEITISTLQQAYQNVGRPVPPFAAIVGMLGMFFAIARAETTPASTELDPAATAYDLLGIEVTEGNVMAAATALLRVRSERVLGKKVADTPAPRRRILVLKDGT